MERGRRPSRPIGEILFSFKGRIGLGDFWLKGLLILLPVVIANAFLAVRLDGTPYVAITWIITAVLLWPLVAVYTKRLHDRDHSGTVLLALLVLDVIVLGIQLGTPFLMSTGPPSGLPVVLIGVNILGGLAVAAASLWLVVVTWFLPSMPGRNEYGPEPGT